MRLAICAVLVGCAGGSDQSQVESDSAVATPPVGYQSRYSKEDAASIASLGIAAGGPRGIDYSTIDGEAEVASLTGRVLASDSISGDSAISPSGVLQSCRSFRDIAMPRRGRGVGNAIVWLTNVSRGKENTLPRRSTIRLVRCTLEPRVQIVARGGTVMIGSRDVVESLVRIHNVLDDPAKPLAHIRLYDFGQVVPVPAIAREAGLVEVRDDLIPWARAFIAVSPHPYIAITDATGSFRMDSVPAGNYELVVFSESLGVRRHPVHIGNGSADVEIDFDRLQ